MTLPTRITAALASEHCSAWARNTIEDIIDRAQAYGGSVTEKQDKLIWKLVEEIEGKAARGNDSRKSFAARPTFDLSRVNRMFDTASANLKRPFAIFATYKPHPTDPKKQVVDVEFRISKAPETGKNPGCLYVKAAGTYVGKLSAEGVFSVAREAPAGVLEALAAFAADPGAAAIAYGQATGNCCYCARELTDARSVTAGYGPICAERWGLPWGITCEEVA